MAPDRLTVIVTGSSGFIGSAVVGKLAEHYTLVGFDRAVARRPPVLNINWTKLPPSIEKMV
jgi:nucleoside-diphosphate-sugar epimerase